MWPYTEEEADYLKFAKNYKKNNTGVHCTLFYAWSNNMLKH